MIWQQQREEERMREEERLREEEMRRQEELERKKEELLRQQEELEQQREMVRREKEELERQKQMDLQVRHNSLFDTLLLLSLFFFADIIIRVKQYSLWLKPENLTEADMFWGMWRW